MNIDHTHEPTHLNVAQHTLKIAYIFLFIVTKQNYLVKCFSQNKLLEKLTMENILHLI